MHVDYRLFMPTYLSFLTERVIILAWTVLKKIDTQIGKYGHIFIVGCCTVKGQFKMITYSLKNWFKICCKNENKQTLKGSKTHQTFAVWVLFWKA